MHAFADACPPLLVMESSQLVSKPVWPSARRHTSGASSSP